MMEWYRDSRFPVLVQNAAIPALPVVLNQTWFCSVFFTKLLFHYKSHSNSIFEIRFGEKSDLSLHEIKEIQSDFGEKSDLSLHEIKEIQSDFGDQSDLSLL